MPCEWNSALPCQFVQHDPNQALRQHNGKPYCLFHLPLDAPDRQPVNLQAIINSWHAQHKYDFTGVQFPSGAYTFDEMHHEQGQWNLARAAFAGGVVLTIQGKTDITDAAFSGDAAFNLARRLAGACGTFGGDVLITILSDSAALNLSKTTFAKNVDLRCPHRAAWIRFRRCRFARPPRVAAKPEAWPQDCDFTGSKFGVTDPAEDEARHRTFRNLFSGNRAREMEGLFYAHEKRCHRRALPRSPRYWPARLFSAAYDVLSSYGRSYELALCWFVIVQVAFGLWYAWASGRLAVSWQPDWQVIAFTLGQAAKPFDLFSGRVLAWPATGVVPDPPGVWAFVAAVHGIASLTTLALMLLALRWRFRRE